MAFPPTLTNPAVTGSVQISGTVNLTASNVTISGSQSVVANQDAATHDLKVIVDSGVITSITNTVNAAITTTIGGGGAGAFASSADVTLLHTDLITTGIKVGTLPALAAGANVIGHVIVDSGTVTTLTNPLAAGTNNIGQVAILPGDVTANAIGNAQATRTGANVLETERPLEWSVRASTTGNTAASAVKAAGAAGVKHVLTGFYALLGNSNVTGFSANLVIRDGASGAGTILFQAQLTVPAAIGDAPPVALTGLNLPGSAATAMTIEFSSANVNAEQDVFMTGYDLV